MVLGTVVIRTVVIRTVVVQTDVIRTVNYNTTFHVEPFLLVELFINREPKKIANKRKSEFVLSCDTVSQEKKFVI
jgi:hypothetical protein